MLLLWTAATLLPDLLDNRYVIRMLGMIGVLFIVLMIPEFWKNKSCDCKRPAFIHCDRYMQPESFYLELSIYL